MNRAARKARIFDTCADFQAFEQVLATAVQRSDVELFAYCIMPTHWHLLIAPKTATALSAFMHWMTTTHSRRWHLAHGTTGEGAVYQGRFKAIPVQHGAHFLWVARYVERNALRAGLVARAEEWAWSSLWQRRQQSDPKWLAAWPVPAHPDWIHHVNTPQTRAEVEAFQQACARGGPFGDPEWTRATMTWMGARRGRPRKMRPDPLTKT